MPAEENIRILKMTFLLTNFLFLIAPLICAYFFCSSYSFDGGSNSFHYLYVELCILILVPLFNQVFFIFKKTRMPLLYSLLVIGFAYCVGYATARTDGWNLKSYTLIPPDRGNCFLKTGELILLIGLALIWNEIVRRWVRKGSKGSGLFDGKEA